MSTKIHEKKNISHKLLPGHLSNHDSDGDETDLA